MKILLAVVGGLLLLIFPFIVMKKAKVTKEENTDEARKKFNVFLICMIPVPLIGFIFLLIGLERKQVKLTIIWNEKISRNKQILTLKKLYPELNKVSTVESYKITKKRRNGNLQRLDGDLLLTFRIKQKKRG